ncbi:hypothetical protein [Bacillus paramycoides]|uniref:hypothetical protein n=1 Tax=Bacillus paramycoides TaxID=2026194 RepID=UPI002E1F50B3|nr:hypothetical protein [Bacillus paramycoides]
MIIDRREWEGTWQMNHDGWIGKLKIFPSKILTYTDQNGFVRPGAIDGWGDTGQFMRFFIEFPPHGQTFDAYMFSWDKTKIAGLTYLNEKTYGFYANKI